MFRSGVRRMATAAKFHNAEPPMYTLGSIRAFPSLEPHEFAAFPADFLDAPQRRDFLWSAVVFEADKARVGSGSAIRKSDQLFSHKKLRPQKGSGRARLGDANSPHMDNPVKAHAIHAPHDWSTKLPSKIYNKAFATAMSEQYRKGNLIIVGGSKASENDTTVADFKYSYPETMQQFIRQHKWNKLNILFVTNEQRDNLLAATEIASQKADVLVKDAVEVRDILRANRIVIELEALQWMIGRYSN